MLDHLVGLLLRALIAQLTRAKPLQVQCALLGRRNPAGIKIVPNSAKASERQPDFRIYSGANELGAGWIKVSRETGKPYISPRIFHIEWGSCHPCHKGDRLLMTSQPSTR